MPRPNPLPTPGSSSDLRGKEGLISAPVFNLPPTALPDVDRASTSSATPSANGSDSSYRPASPTSPATLSRKRSATQSGSVITKDDFTLPPPPTRSRKIIQMKPRDNDVPDAAAQPAATTASTGRATSTAQGSAGGAGGKRKQNNAGTTAAGRKIARKTAHSLIERRRRSKMNEEFGVLKDMIPACRGQEMHKLAILQASIEYLRYLEQCVNDLQAQSNSPRHRPPPPSTTNGDDIEEDEDEDDDEEMHDSPAPTPHPTHQHHYQTRPSNPSTAVPTPLLEPSTNPTTLPTLPSLSQITSQTSTTNPPTPSPSLYPTNISNIRHYSISSAASQPSYSPYFHSTQTSPAFGPSLHHMSTLSNPGAFGLGSPALKPADAGLRQIAEGAMEVAAQGQGQGYHHTQQQGQQQQRQDSGQNMGNGSGSGSGSAVRRTSGRSELELDQEATAALLMLNHDRRSWRGSVSGESGGSAGAGAGVGGSAARGSGMSVRDLLSG